MRSCNQSFPSPCSGIEGAGSQLLQAKLILPFGPLNPCQAPARREGTASCRGAIPQSRHGDKQVETVRSHERNITEILCKDYIAEINVWPLELFSGVGAFSPPWRHHTVFQTPSQESCGDAIKLRMKIEIFYTRGRKQSFGSVVFFISPAIPAAHSSLLSSPSPTLAVPSPFPAWALLCSEQTSALRANSSTEKHGAAQRENSG